VKFDYGGRGGGVGGGYTKIFKKKSLFSGFEVNTKHFLIVEGMALCSIMYQILIILMSSKK